MSETEQSTTKKGMNRRQFMQTVVIGPGIYVYGQAANALEGVATTIDKMALLAEEKYKMFMQRQKEAEKKMPQLIDKPPGKYTAEYLKQHPEELEKIENHEKGSKVAAAYYFYWYQKPNEKTPNGRHWKNDDGTPAFMDTDESGVDMDYTSVEWHKQNLTNAWAAGLDSLILASWMLPHKDYLDKTEPWARDGLTALVQACEELEKEGRDFPKLSLMFDTLSLSHKVVFPEGHADLTKPEDIAMFVRGWTHPLSMIPPRFRFHYDGKPVCMTYASEPVSKYDDQTFRYLRETMTETLGTDVYMIAKQGWFKKFLRNDQFQWGAALHGTLSVVTADNPVTEIATLGFGYDESAVPDRTEKRKREIDLNRFRQEFDIAVQTATFLIFETWNEFHERTQIAPSSRIKTADGQIDPWALANVLAEKLNEWKYAEPQATPEAKMEGEQKAVGFLGRLRNRILRVLRNL